MRKIDDVELKCILLELLGYYADFCEKYGLRYYLGGGTMLGAVRHSGFIPWDDDADVMMPRSDYDRLIRIMNKDCDSRYSLLTHNRVKNYAFPYAKLQMNGTLLIEGMLYKKYHKIGVHIDIFPIDGLPENKTNISKHFAKIQRLLEYNAVATTQIQWGKPYLQKFIRWGLVHTVFKMVSPRFLCSKIEKELLKFDFEQSDNIAAVIGAYGERELMTKNMLAGYKEVSFENLTLRIPIGYDKYLTDHYGKYMELPPLEKRMGHKKREVYRDE